MIEEKDLLALGFERQADDYAAGGEKLIIAYKRELLRDMDVYVTYVKDSDDRLVRETVDFTLGYEGMKVRVRPALRLLKSIVDCFDNLKELELGGDF